MPLFQKKELQTDEEKKLSVVTFWLFVVAAFAWVIPFTVLFLLQLMTQTVGGAIGAALLPSVMTFVVTVLVSAIAFVAYKRLVLKM